VRLQSLVLAGIFFLILSLPAFSPNPPRRSNGFSALVKEIDFSSDLSLWPSVQDPLRRVFKPKDFFYPYEQGIHWISWDLMRGLDSQAALDATQGTTLPAEEAIRRLNSIKAEFQEILQSVRAQARETLMQVGLVLFSTLLLGSLFSALGAEWGMRSSLAPSRQINEPKHRKRATAA
jgi:hypothetical protein